MSRPTDDEFEVMSTADKIVEALRARASESALVSTVTYLRLGLSTFSPCTAYAPCGHTPDCDTIITLADIAAQAVKGD